MRERRDVDGKFQKKKLNDVMSYYVTICRIMLYYVVLIQPTITISIHVFSAMSNSRLLIGVLFYLLPHCLACPSTDDTFIFLQAIYNRTNPNLWTTNNWFAGTDCCTWHGVTCNGAMGINSLDVHTPSFSNVYMF
jgi:hypothetical protein